MTGRFNALWVLGGLLVLISALWLPVSYERILTEGTDTYKTHYPLFGSRQAKQSIVLHHDITSVGALLVNLRRASEVVSVHMKVTDSEGRVLGEGDVVPQHIRDDAFGYARPPHIIRQEVGEITVEVSAPQATAQNPIGIRFEEQGEKRFAVAVIERVPLYVHGLIWQAAHPVATHRLAAGLLGALVVGLVGTFLYERKVLESKRGWYVALLILALFTVAVRWPLVSRIEGVFGGDAYNHLLKTRAWIQGDDPFASDFRKGPFFSVLLAPGLAIPDPLLWARWVGVISSVAAVVLLAVLARGLSVPPVMAWLTGALLAVTREFRFESVSALSNTTFAALVMATCVAFLYAKRKKIAYVMSIAGGLAALTRYEGVLVPGIFLPAVWAWHHFRPRFIGYTIWPLIILVAIPFVMWPITGQIGVRTPGDITSDAGLSVALSWHEFQQNASQLKTILGREWFISPAGGRQLLTLGIGLVSGVVLAMMKRRWPAVVGDVLAAAPWTVSLWVVAVVFRDFHDTLKLLMLAMTLLAGAGAGWLMVQKPRFGIPIVLMVLLQAVVVTAILPKSRYYLHLLPFLVLGVGVVVSGVARWRSRWNYVGSLCLLGLLAGLVWYEANDALGDMVSDYNSRARQAAVMERAAKFLRPLDGAFTITTDDLAFRVFVGDERMKMFPRELERRATDVEQQLAWIRQSGVRYIVETSFEPLFVVVQQRPELFQELGRFTSHYGSGEVVIYELQ